MKCRIEQHLESEGVIREEQHGFRYGRSPTTNLIDFFEQTTKWLDDGLPFDIVYFDFAKAFDKVCHKRLVTKLQAAGIWGTLLDWIQDWLSRRRQRVVVDGKSSEWKPVDSGVLQGTVLGPIFFIIFNNDLEPKVDNTMAILFADDTKAARVVANQEQAKLLQETIDSFATWADEWSMEFNVGKCKVMHVGCKNPRLEYTMNGKKLEQVEEEKDLGVWTQSNLKPSLQCAKAAQAANVALGLLLRSFHYRSKTTLIPLYKTFVRSRMEHAVAAWSPWLERDVDVLERVQKRLIRALSDVRGQTYEEKLQDAGLTTLRERRHRGDLIETFKTLKGVYKVDSTKWFHVIDHERARQTRGSVTMEEGEPKPNTNVLYKPSANHDVRNNFFTLRVVRSWNALPEHVRNQKSVNAFKGALDKWTEENRKKQTLCERRDAINRNGDYPSTV